MASPTTTSTSSSSSMSTFATGSALAVGLGMDITTTTTATATNMGVSFSFQVVPNFVGCLKELSMMEELFEMEPYSKGVLISGIGGVGKSTLVKQFVANVSQKQESGSRGPVEIAWTAGQTAQSLQISLAKLLMSSLDQGPSADMKSKELLRLIRQRGVKNGVRRWIFILDNYEVWYEEMKVVRKLVTWGNCFLIVTSRRRDVLHGDLEFLELSPLRLEDSVALVKSSLASKIKTNAIGYHGEDEGAITELCVMLGNLPLALRRGVRYIKLQRNSDSLVGAGYSVRDFVEGFKAEITKMTKYPKLEGYLTEVLHVRDFSLLDISKLHGLGKVALRTLQILAYLSEERTKYRWIWWRNFIRDSTLETRENPRPEREFKRKTKGRFRRA